METMTFESGSYPVKEHIYIKELGKTVPLLDIPMMDDATERELGVQSAEAWKEAAK